MSENEATRLLEDAEIVPAPMRERIDPSKLELSEIVIQLNRVAKVVKGGRRFSFAALVVVGDYNGHVGIGFGKANEVPDSIQKAVQNGRKNLIFVPRIGRTIPYTVIGEFSAARVMIRPASEGTGLIAGPAVRGVLELAGIKDVLTKNLGSSNVINIVKAVVEGLRSLRDGESVVRLRGKSLEEVMGSRRAAIFRTCTRSVSEPVPSAAPRSAAVVTEESAPAESGAMDDPKNISDPSDSTEGTM